MGLWLGFGGIIVVCLLVSPVIGILWYVQTVKETKTAIKEKARRERKDEDAQQQ